MLKLFKYLRAYKWKVTLILVLVLIQALAELMLPTLLANIVDIGIYTGDTNYILRIGGLMLIVTAFGALSTIWKSYLSARVSSAFGREVRRDVFKKIESFSMKEFDEVSTSSLITRTTNDVTQVRTIVVQILNMFLRAPMMAIGGVIMALSKDTQLSQVLGVVLVIMTIIIIYIASKAVPLFKVLQVRIDKMNLTLRERLTGIRVIRAFNKTTVEKNRFKKANKDLTSTAIKINKLMATLMPTMTFLFNITTALILYFGAIRINNGAFLVGDLMAFIQYATMIMFSLIMFTMMFIMLPRAQVSANRINQVLDMEPVIVDGKNENLEINERSIKYDSVNFSYNGAEMNAIEDISFEVEAGETLAIIGGTGSGKSTIVNLLPRLYNRTKGSINIGGHLVEDYSLKSLRELISFVPQKTILLSGTIKHNVTLGKDLKDNQLEEVLRVAQASEFVNKLENGVEHIVSQGGTNLSGGQKQRLSIARALAKDTLCYVFDDSFSALDFKTDSNLRKELKTYLKDKISIIIAQRVSSIKDADKIIVIDNGKIVGRGTHSELLDSCIVYQKIVYSQLDEEEL